ncbi:hypothetical protein MNBD_NITROSPIRAE01-717 [hydrothermal vent metagenome]|uniref:STAS domain-containing protein n=1 Tax=hydrothermal vent metagenome TaxID=652676 RepID=A0A3B1CJ10_9ZZZZ
MALNVEVKNHNGRLRLMMSGRFDFNSNRNFRKAYEDGMERYATGPIELDFNGVDYMDSSALGMLLLFKERAEELDRSISLVNCQESVLEILDVVNFGKLFSIK